MFAGDDGKVSNRDLYQCETNSEEYCRSYQAFESHSR